MTEGQKTTNYKEMLRLQKFELKTKGLCIFDCEISETGKIICLNAPILRSDR